MDLLHFCKYLLFLGLLVQFSNGNPRYQGYNGNSNLQNSNEFDLLIFTQSWLKTVCFQEKSKLRTCILPKNAEWSIHGLWPEQLHKIGPSFCNKNLYFNPAALKRIREELKNKWANVHSEKYPESFWKHEWDKHGTCAATLESTNSEEKYFQKSLELFDKYNMKNVLEEANIFPGDEYPVEQILDAVNKVLGVNSQVTCLKNPETQEQHIMEIRLCFSKQFKLHDCNGIVSFPTNCDRSINVTY